MQNFWETDKIELQIHEGVAVSEDSDFRILFDIWDKDENCVGSVFVDKMDARVGRCELSIFVEVPYRRRGYGRDAARLVMDYLFLQKRYHRVWSEVAEDTLSGMDQVAEAFLQSLGFQKEGTWKEQCKGKDVLVYSLLSEEWVEKKVQPVLCEPFACAERKGKHVSLRLLPMTREAYAYKHEIMYDMESSFLLDGTIHLPGDPEVLSEWEEKHLDGKLYGGCIEYALVNEDDEIVGTAGLDGIDKEEQKFSYHIYVFDECQGMGYGSTGLYLLLKEGFVNQGMRKMYTYIDVGNAASLCTAFHNGCGIEGIARAMEFYQGHFVDDYMVGVTREEFMNYHGI